MVREPDRASDDLNQRGGSCIADVLTDVAQVATGNHKLIGGTQAGDSQGGARKRGAQQQEEGGDAQGGRRKEGAVQEDNVEGPGSEEA